MKIVPFSEDRWSNESDGHPNDRSWVQDIIQGDPNDIENFWLILVSQRGADYSVPRHRHNHDQIRLAVLGDFNLGPMSLGEGQCAYFSEGTPYGPQNDPVGHRLQLVLQFGGASGYGYMSMKQRREAWRELSKVGTFEGPRYHHADGRVEWALNAIWEHVFGAKLKYPRPRYKHPVIVDPKSFNWLPLGTAVGVDHKLMGSYTERGVWIEKIRIAKGATWISTDIRSRRILTVLAGGGDVEGQVIGKFAALQVNAGETLSVSALEEMELFLIGLPPVETPAVESDQYDTGEELPEEEVMAA